MATNHVIPASGLGTLPVAEHLGDTHLIARGFNVIFGPSGAYKSFYALDVALNIAQSHPVVYVAAEGVSGMHARVNAWCDYFKSDPGDLHFVCNEVNLLNPKSVGTLAVDLKPLRPVLVIFDTLARCIPGGDENSAKDMGVAVRHTAFIQRQLDCASTWIHHTNRAERGERGSGAMRGAADAMIELYSNGDNVIRIKCSKAKDGEPWTDEEMHFFPVGQSGVLLPGGTADPTKLTDAEWRILEFLSLEVFSTAGAKTIQIVNSLNIPERSIYRLLSRLKANCQINQDTKGDPYTLSASGRALLCQRQGQTPQLVKFPKVMDLTN